MPGGQTLLDVPPGKDLLGEDDLPKKEGPGNGPALEHWLV